MSLTGLPSEVLGEICEILGNDSIECATGGRFPDKSEMRRSEYESMDKADQGLKALRLTSKWISVVATRYLFRHVRISSLRSIDKFESLVDKVEFAKQVRSLSLKSFPISYCDLSELKDFNVIGLLPNLQLIKSGGLNWSMAKRRAGAPAGDNCLDETAASHQAGCMFQLNSGMWDPPDTIHNLYHLQSYGFELRSLSLRSEARRFQVDWPRLDLGNLRTLRLKLNDPRMDPNTTILLPRIFELPNLTFFGLEQSRHPEGIVTSTTPTLIKQLGDKKWPSLRVFEFGHLIAKVADLKDFLLPHNCSLDRLSMSTPLVYFNNTMEELEASRGLPDWIKNHILPRELSLPNTSFWDTTI